MSLPNTVLPPMFRIRHFRYMGIWRRIRIQPTKINADPDPDHWLRIRIRCLFLALGFGIQNGFFPDPRSGISDPKPIYRYFWELSYNSSGKKSTRILCKLAQFFYFWPLDSGPEWVFSGSRIPYPYILESIVTILWVKSTRIFVNPWLKF